MKPFTLVLADGTVLREFAPSWWRLDRWAWWCCVRFAPPWVQRLIWERTPDLRHVTINGWSHRLQAYADQRVWMIAQPAMRANNRPR